MYMYLLMNLFCYLHEYYIASYDIFVIYISFFYVGSLDPSKHTECWKNRIHFVLSLFIFSVVIAKIKYFVEERTNSRLSNMFLFIYNFYKTVDKIFILYYYFVRIVAWFFQTVGVNQWNLIINTYIS